MTFIPTQSGFMNLEDSEKLLRAIFPNYPSLEPRYRRAKSGTDCPGQRRSEQLAMFYITAGTKVHTRRNSRHGGYALRNYPPDT